MLLSLLEQFMHKTQRGGMYMPSKAAKLTELLGFVHHLLAGEKDWHERSGDRNVQSCAGKESIYH